MQIATERMPPQNVLYNFFGNLRQSSHNINYRQVALIYYLHPPSIMFTQLYDIFMQIHKCEDSFFKYYYMMLLLILFSKVKNLQNSNK